MKRVLGLVVVLVLTGTASSQEPGMTERLPDYFPLKAGAKWHYRVLANGNEGKMITQVPKIEKIDDKPLARLEAVVNDQIVATEHLSTTNKGIFRYRANGAEAVPPVPVLKYPVKPGDTWKVETTVNNQKITISSKVGQEEVTVPAGKFKAVTVESDVETVGQSFKSTFWFVEGKGWVKQTLDLPGGKVVMELEKFEPGK